MCATKTKDMEDKEQRFSAMVRENKSTILTVCYMFSKDQDEVNDLFQEVLIKLWQGFATYQERSGVKTWIYRVALNTCITLYHKKKRHRDAMLDMQADLFSGNSRDARQIEILHHRISQLGLLDRAIVLLWLEDISYEEIASIIGITVKNVSVRLYRIREQLKKMPNE